MDTFIALFALVGLLAVVITVIVCLFLLACLMFSPIYCAPYWWYAGNKRCDGWYKSDGLWCDIKKATYIYFCWITHKKTPES